MSDLRTSTSLHEIVSRQCGRFGNICWWIGWKVWPFNRFSPIRSWGTRQWIRSRAIRHENAARMLLQSDWRGGYCYVDGKPYTLRIYDGHIKG